jgi:hypothetical protein
MTDTPPQDHTVMIERLERAIQLIAGIIVRYNEPEYGPLLDRLERELEHYRGGRPDALSRARAALQKYGEPDWLTAPHKPPEWIVELKRKHDENIRRIVSEEWANARTLS